MKTEKIGGGAALLNTGVAVGNLVVVFGVLGAAVAADPARVTALVVTRPAPLLWLEGFKILAAAAVFVLVQVLDQRLRATAVPGLTIARMSGLLSALLLLLAGLLGGLAILQGGYGLGTALLPAGATYANINSWINRLGLTALFCNGVWLLLIGWNARNTHRLPPGLCYLAMIGGIANLLALILPPVALLALVLGLLWSLWLGVLLIAA